MGYRTLVVIDGQRHDITGVTLTRELTCDRCNRYMTVKLAMYVPPELVDGAEEDVQVELCMECARLLYPGLPDLAVKVAGRA